VNNDLPEAADSAAGAPETPQPSDRDAAPEAPESAERVADSSMPAADAAGDDAPDTAGDDEPDSAGPDAPVATANDPDSAAPTADDAPVAAANPDGFSELGLDERLLRTISDLGYEEATPIQRAAIPPLLNGKDLLAEAPTGTGKTAAFALPMLQRLAAIPRVHDGRRESRLPIGLVLAPTRELAMQVAEAIHRYGRGIGASVLPIYGGQAYPPQLRALTRGVDVIVATPGRAVDHLERGSLRLEEVQVVVLDEADEMLDMGFAEDLDRILASLPAARQTALFSATINPQIARLAQRHLTNPTRIAVQKPRPSAAESARVRQVAYVVRRSDKLAALGRLLDLEDPSAALVFARTRGEVDDLAEALSGRGHDAGALHGGLSQEQRDRIMGRFREGQLDVLVATDVAARGLDIEHVSHVVNFDVPSSAEVYVHRIGRTGRAGRDGVAITLLEPREHRLLRNIEGVIGKPLDIGQLPTVADVREHRMDSLRATLREALLADGFARYRGVIEPLAEEFDLVDVAMAAVSLADAESRGAEDEAELAPAALPRDAFRPAPGMQRTGRPRPGYGDQRPGPAGYDDRRQGPGPRTPYDQRPVYDQRGPRPGPDRRPDDRYGRGPGDRPASPPYRAPYGAPPPPEARGPRGPEPGFADRPEPDWEGGGRQAPQRGFRVSGWKDADGRPVPKTRRVGQTGAGMTRLFVGAGRSLGMRPGDLVGAITNEAGLRGGDIGAIQIADGFSLVEVPDATADRVIAALRAATIRGAKVAVRRERY
jgi:ATP-dependent RNA helicase DeaD